MLSTGSRKRGGAVVVIALLSNSWISCPLIIVFCFFLAGPLAEGVGGIADMGVGGIVAEAGVRGT